MVFWHYSSSLIRQCTILPHWAKNINILIISLPLYLGKQISFFLKLYYLLSLTLTYLYWKGIDLTWNWDCFEIGNVCLWNTEKVCRRTLMPCGGGRGPRGAWDLLYSQAGHEFIWVHFFTVPFPPSHVKIDIKLEHMKLPFCSSKTVWILEVSYGLTLVYSAYVHCRLYSNHNYYLGRVLTSPFCFSMSDYSIRKKALLHNLPKELYSLHSSIFCKSYCLGTGL